MDDGPDQPGVVGGRGAPHPLVGVGWRVRRGRCNACSGGETRELNELADARPFIRCAERPNLVGIKEHPTLE
jgi:hypothetical protein